MSTPTGEITKIQLKTKVTADKLWVKTLSGTATYKLNSTGSVRTATTEWIEVPLTAGEYLLTDITGEEIRYATSDTIPTGNGNAYEAGAKISVRGLSEVSLDRGEPLFDTNNNTLIIGTVRNGNASQSATIGDWWSLVDKPSVHLKTVDNTYVNSCYNSSGYYPAEDVYQDVSSALGSIPAESMKQHEICVIRTLINTSRQVEPVDSTDFANGTPIRNEIQHTKYQYSGYVYDLTIEQWCAMDGDYDARHVFMSGSIKLAGEYTNVGNMDKGDVESWKLYNWDGKSVQDVLTEMLQKELEPETPTPTISMRLTNAGSYEIGTPVTPSFQMTYNPGKYKYGSETYPKNNTTTNAKIDTCTITLSTGSDLTVTPSSKTLAENGSAQTWTQNASSMVVTSSTEYYGSKIDCTYVDGAIPYTNIKNPRSNLRVPGATITNNTDTGKIVHYREGCFYGAVKIDGLQSSMTVNQVKAKISANTIRTLDKRLSANYSSGKKTAFDVIANDTIILVACPVGKTGPTSVLNTTVNAEMKDNLKSFTMNVGGYDSTSSSVGAYATEYRVWYYVPDKPYENKASITVTLG